MSKISKVIVSSRIHPDLKFDLDVEAETIGITTSKYLERIIEHRFDVSDDKDSNKSDTVAELEAKIQELETTNENMSTQLDAFEEDNEELKEQLALLQESPPDPEPQFPIELGETELEQLNQFMKKLRKVHPGTSDSLLLLGALDTTLRAEKAVWLIPTINRFLNQKKQVS